MQSRPRPAAVVETARLLRRVIHLNIVLLQLLGAPPQVHSTNSSSDSHAPRFCILNDALKTPELFLEHVLTIRAAYEANGTGIHNFFPYGRDTGKQG